MRDFSPCHGSDLVTLYISSLVWNLKFDSMPPYLLYNLNEMASTLFVLILSQRLDFSLGSSAQDQELSPSECQSSAFDPLQRALFKVFGPLLSVENSQPMCRQLFTWMLLMSVVSCEVDDSSGLFESKVLPGMRGIQFLSIEIRRSPRKDSTSCFPQSASIYSQNIHSTLCILKFPALSLCCELHLFQQIKYVT